MMPIDSLWLVSKQHHNFKLKFIEYNYSVQKLILKQKMKLQDKLKPMMSQLSMWLCLALVGWGCILVQNYLYGAVHLVTATYG